MHLKDEVNLPVEWPQELHPALLGDHLDCPGDGVVPVAFEPETNPAELDLTVGAARQVVHLLHLAQLGAAATKDPSMFKCSVTQLSNDNNY